MSIVMPKHTNKTRKTETNVDMTTDYLIKKC